MGNDIKWAQSTSPTRTKNVKCSTNAGYKGKDFLDKKRHSTGRRVPSASWMGLQHLFIGEVLSFISVIRAHIQTHGRANN